jgi:ribonuclease BN (tRNA processing enzyme)
MAHARGDHSIGYTADTGPITNLGTFFRGVEALVCEATLLESTVSPMERSHLTAAEAGRLASTCQAKRLVLTHFWEELGAERLLAAAAETFAGPIEMAWPGQELSV